MTTTVADARRLATDLLTAVGVGKEEAARTAWAIVLADCWGVGSHGLMRLPHYLRRLQAGGCRPDAELSVVTDTGPLLSLNGGDGLGHWQVWRAAELAAERCGRYGVSAVGVADTSHSGALGVYTLPVVRAGYAALVFCNGPAVMPPWQGSRAVLSTSPIAAGLPGADRPVIVDLATTTVARGRIAQRAATGEELPDGWAYDASGAPTRDPAAALVGMLAPMGGAKGFALAFLVEALTGAMVGPALSTDVVDMFAAADSHRPQRISHLVLGIDPAAMAPDGSGPRRLALLVESVEEAGGRVPGSRRTPPEDIDDEAALPLAPQVAADLADWAARLGV